MLPVLRAVIIDCVTVAPGQRVGTITCGKFCLISRIMAGKWGRGGVFIENFRLHTGRESEVLGLPKTQNSEGGWG